MPPGLSPGGSIFMHTYKILKNIRKNACKIYVYVLLYSHRKKGKTWRKRRNKKMESAKMIELETTAASLYDGGWGAEDREELKGVKAMKFVVRSETTEALCCSDKFDTLEEAREQMSLWVEVDDDGESQDWADYILSVPDEDVEDAVHGHADTEKFAEGKCGNEYHGSHYWEM